MTHLVDVATLTPEQQAALAKASREARPSADARLAIDLLKRQMKAQTK